MPFFHDQSRTDLRRMYMDAWRKYRRQERLEPLEAQIAAVIAEHPEYHSLLESDAALAAQFPPELGATNPFLHLGLHLAIREQVSTDRPAGIADLHRELAHRLGSSLDAEHRILEVLGEVMWEAQSAGTAPPDPSDYLDRIRSRVNRTQ
jgi:hypothetical protein